MGITGRLPLLMVIPFWPMSRWSGAQKCFDRGGDDIAPFEGMHIAHHTSLGEGSSQFPWTKGGGGPGDDKLGDELMFDLDTNLEADDAAGLGIGTPSVRTFVNHVRNICQYRIH